MNDFEKKLAETRISAIRQYAQEYAMSASDIDDVWSHGIASIAQHQNPRPAWLDRATCCAPADSPVVA